MEAEVTQNARDWVDYLAALLTPTIAIIGSIIAFLQWWTNRKRLKHELFDRRYKQFEAVRDFIGSILSSGKSKREEQYKYLTATQGFRFIFDEELAKDIRESVWEKAVLLETLDAELEGVPKGAKRSENARKMGELKKELHSELEGLDAKFAKYLQLRH